jgi:hypothetical protein
LSISSTIDVHDSSADDLVLERSQSLFKCEHVPELARRPTESEFTPTLTFEALAVAGARVRAGGQVNE